LKSSPCLEAGVSVECLWLRASRGMHVGSVGADLRFWVDGSMPGRKGRGVEARNYSIERFTTR
jgi:hypothetical protein